MIVSVPKETFSGEKRVALVPAMVPPLLKAGLEVVVESSAGALAGYPDDQYAEKGARIADNRDQAIQGDVILQVRAAGPDDLPSLKSGQTVIGMCDPLSEPQVANQVADIGATLFSLEMLPRITRAQSMDVLSSMATVAGYRAVLLAAEALPQMFPMLMTAAGTLSPARVLVIGAGVAGLQAIATARRLGAVVTGYDVRPVVKEQVESLGAKFLEMELETSEAEGGGGYAQQMDEEFYRKQREMMSGALAETDVVVTTAAIPGKKAPVLITADMVAGMPPAAVIVDLAAERGGNCELTQAGQTIMEHGVTILGPTNLPSDVARHASQMYSKNITTFLLHLVDEGQLKLDMEDEIVSDTLIARDGEVVNPRIRELLGMAPLETPGGGPSNDEQGEES